MYIKIYQLKYHVIYIINKYFHITYNMRFIFILLSYSINDFIILLLILNQLLSCYFVLFALHVICISYTYYQHLYLIYKLYLKVEKATNFNK